MTPLKANNITTAEVAGFTKTGTTYRAKRVTFFVGQNGPFQHDFPVDVDPSTITDYIDGVVAKENTLQQRYAT